jgi:hypothetical protein
VDSFEASLDELFSESSPSAERQYTWMVGRMKEEGYLMNSAVLSLLDRKADSSEVSGALSRTAHSVDGLLDDLSAFKTEIRKQFDNLASKLTNENNSALSYKQEARADLTMLMKQISKEECEKNSLQAVEEAVKRLTPKLVSEAARQEVRHVARGLVQQVAREEVPEEVRQALEKSLQIHQLQSELTLLIERIVRVEASWREVKEGREKEEEYRMKNEESIRRELKAMLKSELSVDMSVEVQRLGDEIMSRNEMKLSDLVKQVALAAEERVSVAAGAAASSAVRNAIDQVSFSTNTSRDNAPQPPPPPRSSSPIQTVAPPHSPQKSLALLGLSGRWLWRSGHLEDSHWIPWEVEALNSNPSELIWTTRATSIIAKVPGLYKLSFSFFTHAVINIEVCLNGEPILTLCPLEEEGNSKYALSNNHGSARMRSHDALYEIRRNRHSVGDVSQICLFKHVFNVVCLSSHTH